MRRNLGIEDLGDLVELPLLAMLATHRRRDPRASIVVCEQTPPYRGVELRASAQLSTAGVHDAVRRIASRYLGAQTGAQYADSAADDVLIRLEPGELRAWDFADEAS